MDARQREKIFATNVVRVLCDDVVYLGAVSRLRRTWTLIRFTLLPRQHALEIPEQPPRITPSLVPEGGNRTSIDLG